MADAAAGLERSIDTTSYSPIARGDRATSNRIPRSPDASIDASDTSHQDLASLVRNGAMRLEMGNEAEAEECFRKALEIGDRTLGADHPDLILLLNDLTRLYLRQSAYAAAEPLLLRLLELKRSKVTIENAPVVDEASPAGVATVQTESAPYLPVLETIREELEAPDQSGSLAERTRAIQCAPPSRLPRTPPPNLRRNTRAYRNSKILRDG